MSRLLLAVSVSILTAAVSLAQTKQPSDDWLMQNYHFADPPAPGEIKQVTPAVAQLQEIQNTLLNILRKANFAGDYEAALAAAAQAAATAQQIAAMSGELPRTGELRQRQQPQATHYLIAFKDSTVQEATAVWRDSLMLHYTTPKGAHEQVRLDLVDWRLCAQLNPRSGQAWLRVEHKVASADPQVTAAP